MYNLEDVKNFRGFRELTQQCKEIEIELIDNVNELKSKRLGFNKTRLKVLNQTTLEDTIEWVAFCRSSHTYLTTNKTNKVIEMCIRENCEKFYRDFVTEEMAHEILDNVARKCISIGQENVVGIINESICCSNLEEVHMPTLYLRCMDENSKGEFIDGKGEVRRL